MTTSAGEYNAPNLTPGLYRIEVSAPGFNVFNRVIFGTGSTNLNAGNFGIVTSTANDPRQMQLGLKLYW